MKTAEAVKNAFENLFQQAKPKNIQTDKGSEFYNSQLKSLFQRHSINHYSAEGDHKASVVERFNRTLKNKMFRVFTYRNSYKYVDILHLLVKSYNDTEHRNIGMAPSQVTREVEPQIFKKLYGFLEKNPKVILNKGDLVRISKANKTFRRGYLPGWSDEVFRVKKVYFSHPTTFELQDLKSEAIKGRFYAEELQKISKRSDDYWRIEKVLKTKGIGRKKEYYVKWQGFDERFNPWVKEAWMSSKERRTRIKIIICAPFYAYAEFDQGYCVEGEINACIAKIDRPPLNEYFRVSITDKPTVPEKVKKTENLQLEVGFYKNAEQLFSSFKHLAFNLLANKKVKIHIPDTSAVTFQDGLKDLLGLKQSTLHGGTHISDYQLELDGGITEIYVYTDIIESHFVGILSHLYFASFL
ncbi:uncharacterized transposon-derived protein F54H12.3 [Trichonephila clavata]|uniref:Uncharacterized transposon-derived protein F54H12.3 n=1 Tax=Trichonephila clavata TaxID=2740835 RepID=A0A8X6HFQ0_TRICU|nr:uncharacterized transposon-derived protein F54H12.3 [Trichonephila clavata]